MSNLKLRYQKGKIYTYIGEVVVSINPYKPLLIYDKEYVQVDTHLQYLSTSLCMKLAQINFVAYVCVLCVGGVLVLGSSVSACVCIVPHPAYSS